MNSVFIAVAGWEVLSASSAKGIEKSSMQPQLYPLTTWPGEWEICLQALAWSQLWR